MAYIDCFGHIWASLDKFSPPKILHTFDIATPDGQRPGKLFFLEGLKVGRVWTHSLLSHGREPFATSAEATDDFYETKLGLPSAVHKQIFGT